MISTVISQEHPANPVTDDQNLNAIADELDSMHASARHAFRSRDIINYRSFFTDDLRYVQSDGKEIGIDELMRDVSKQLTQFKAVDSRLTRESIEMNDNGTVTQLLKQIGTYSLSVFLVFTKTWNIDRRGKYTYRKTDSGWRICDVEVLSENLR